MAQIEFRHVSKRYGSKIILKDFSLEIAQGERLVLVGPSGCGKTTILRLLAGFIVPNAGEISIDGVPVAAEGRNLKEPEERNLGMVFQDLALWPHLNVRGNLEFGLKAKRIGKVERQQRMSEVLRLVQMTSSVDASIAELSGGEQQRVALARALVLHPKILLMDEPLSSLDSELSIQIRKEIIGVQSQIGFTLVYVTHGFEEAFDLGTRVIMIKQGRMNWTGTREEFAARLSYEHV